MKSLLISCTPIAFDSTYVPTASDVEQARKNAKTQTTDEMLKRSPDIAAMVPYWDKTDAINGGITAVRLAGTDYLPKFVDETDKEYSFRLSNTKMTNIFPDVVGNLAAKPFEQSIAVVSATNAFVDEFVADVDGSGNDLTAFGSSIFFNGINSAIHWIFVDHPKQNETIKTLADEKRAGLRPYWSHVLGRNILDAKSEVINGKETLTYIKILEPGTPDHVRIFERSIDGLVVWALYQKSDKSEGGKTQFVEIENGTISIGVIPLVPFITGRRNGRTWEITPALRDAADLQIELYQQESGLKFAKVLTAYPMLAGNGVKPQMEADKTTIKRIAVGPNRVLYAPPDANGNIGSWNYVEPNAQSLAFLASDIKETQMQLRELGKQPLTAQSGNLTVITTAVAAGKAKSAVAAWAGALKLALEKAMNIALLFRNETYVPEFSVYDDFDEFTEGKDLDALGTARANKDISQKTYWHELQRRGVLSSAFDHEQEEANLLEELPGDGDDMKNIETMPNDPEL